MIKNIDITQVAESLPFEASSEYSAILLSDNTRDAIEEAYSKAKGIRTFPFELHYVSGTGLNTTMSNGAFFRVRPGTSASGSYSGYPSAFPLQSPFNCKLYSIVLTFRNMNFDWSATSGPICFEIETRNHYYNGSDVSSRVQVTFGNFSGSLTGHDTWRYELFYNTSGDGFYRISGDEFHNYGDMIGCRFVKASVGDRKVNSMVDVVMKLNYEEVVD